MPSKEILKLEKLVKKFLWEGPWEVLICSVEESSTTPINSSLKIDNIKLWNQALLAKWLWRYLNEPEALWCSKVIKAKYVSSQSDSCPKQPSRSCWMPWHFICELKANIMDNPCNSVGNGETTFFWTDIWLENRSLCSRFPYLYRLTHYSSSKVENLCCPEKNCWNLSLQRTLKDNEIKEWPSFSFKQETNFSLIWKRKKNVQGLKRKKNQPIKENNGEKTD